MINSWRMNQLQQQVIELTVFERGLSGFGSRLIESCCVQSALRCSAGESLEVPRISRRPVAGTASSRLDIWRPWVVDHPSRGSSSSVPRRRHAGRDGQQ